MKLELRLEMLMLKLQRNKLERQIVVSGESQDVILRSITNHQLQVVQKKQGAVVGVGKMLLQVQQGRYQSFSLAGVPVLGKTLPGHKPFRRGKTQNPAQTV
jgi:hypothetical protein